MAGSIGPEGGLAALPPAQRAALIYGAARSEMSDRLWQAALGNGDAATRGDGPQTARQANLDSLVATLARQSRRDDAPASALASLAATEAAGIAAPAAEATPARAATGLGLNAGYAAVLDTAAARTGIPSAALASIVDAEAAKTPAGCWQPLSRNPRSSAAGLGQFLTRTWEGMAERKGTWLHGLAEANGWLDDAGQMRAQARTELLALRYDPTAAINGVADYARGNLDTLARAGVSTQGDATATARIAYLAHHLGAGDAVRFLRNGGLSESRARVLLCAQVGSAVGEHRIADAGNATAAHRIWLTNYLDHRIGSATSNN